MARPNSFARRFIAGETLDEALVAARALQAAGFHLTLDYLGESVGSFDAATAAAREYVKLVDAIVVSGIERNISLKLTQLGAGIDLATCVDNLRRIVDAAQQVDCFVRIDMENSPYTERTLEAFEILWQRHYRNLGVALQACLHRTGGDIQRMNELGARVRLVKGAYKEPPNVAYQKKAEVDDAFVRHTRTLLDARHLPGDRHSRSGDAERRLRLRGQAGDRLRPLRVPDAVRRAARPAEEAGGAGAPHARLRPVREGMVSVFHAPAG